MAAVFGPNGAMTNNSAPEGNNPVALLATRLSNLSLDDIIACLGGDRPRASRIRSGEREATIAELAKLIPLCGLKLVAKDKVCVDRQAYESMTYIASKAMADQQVAQRLIWDEGQGT